jgi:hypothetical protein
MPAIFVSPANAAMLGRPVDPLAAVKAATVLCIGFNNTSADSGPNSFTVSAVNTPGYVDLPTTGKAAELQSSSFHYFNIAHDAKMCPAGGFTFYTWFYSASSGGLRAMMHKGDAGTDSNRSYQMFWSAANRLRADLWTTGTGSGSVTALTHGTTLSVDTWYFGKMKWDGATLSCNVNEGTAVTAALGGTGVAPGSTPMPLRLGGFPSNAAPSSEAIQWNGRLSTQLMVNRATTPQEDALVYAQGVGFNPFAV